MIIRNKQDALLVIQDKVNEELYVEWPLDTFIISHDHKLLYMPIAKNACSSLKTVFLEDIISEKSSVTDAHKYFASSEGIKHTLASLDAYKAASILINEDYKKLIIVREPLERIVSGYLQKFVSTRLYTDEPLPEVKNIIDWCAEQNSTTPNYVMSLSFNEFVRYLLAHSDESLDTHWKPQVTYMADLTFDYIFTMGNLNNAFDFLEKISGKSINRRSLNKLIRSENVGVYTGDLLPLQILSIPLLGYVSYDIALKNIADTRQQFKENYDAFTMPATVDMLNNETMKSLKERYIKDFELYERHLNWCSK